MDSRVVRQLNEIRASEQRMSLIYRRCADAATGPYRNALSQEFSEHAYDEDRHASHAQRHIIALGGSLDVDVKQIPVWRTLDEMLRGLEELEEKGVRLWQELLRMLPDDDAFRHTVEEVLSKEQEHWDDVRRLIRTDYTEKSMKTPGDIGSRVPLNLNQRTLLPLAQAPRTSHAERVEKASRAGTPITRRGAFNGAMPAFEPSIPAELNPPLILKGTTKLPDGSGFMTGTVKAVNNPADAGTGSGDSVSRKRDPGTGKFSDSPVAGPVTTAKDDQAAAERNARLAAKRYLKALGVPDKPMPTQQQFQPPAQGQQQGQPPQQGQAPQGPQLAPDEEDPQSQAGIPGSPPGQAGAGVSGSIPGSPPGQNDMQAQGPQPIGQSQDGMPIYDDPYHPDHGAFESQHHDDAAQLHQQLAEQATNQGRIPTAMEHQMKASIHGDMSRDAMSPMTRMAMDQQGVQGMEAQPGQPPQPTGGVDPGAPGPGQGGPNSRPQMDAMNQFLTQLPDQVPGVQNAPMDTGPNQMTNPAADVAGPKPRMKDTRTGGPIGPLTPVQQHAGTMPQPEQMPMEPPPGAGSMPQIGQGQDDSAGMEAVMPQQEQGPNAAGAEQGMPGHPGPTDEPNGATDAAADTGPGQESSDFGGQPAPDDEQGAYSDDLQENNGGFSWDPALLDEDQGGDGGADPEGDQATPQQPQDDSGPTPGASESEPGRQAGPSTEDKPPRAGNPIGSKANKSLVSWLDTI